MSTLTDQEIFLIHQQLHGMYLPAGLGTEESACSIAAINLALTGRLTDEIPACMSEVIGQWIIRVQDAMPDGMRNSDRWKNLLPLAAGTGRDHEQERLAIILDWMWGVVLPSLQPLADSLGFADAWQRMTEERAARAVKAAAAKAAEAAASDAARAVKAAAEAAASDAARAVKAAAKAAEAAAAWAAWAAAWAAEAAAWETFDPCSVLEKLIEAGK